LQKTFSGLKEVARGKWSTDQGVNLLAEIFSFERHSNSCQRERGEILTQGMGIVREYSGKSIVWEQANRESGSDFPDAMRPYLHYEELHFRFF